MTGCISSKPASISCFSMISAGRGVILSIMLHGKETRASSFTYASKSAGTSPFFTHAATISITLARSFSPLWEQLSMLTMAIGIAPA